MINQGFYPDIDATSQLMTDLAEDMIGSGLEVTVISGRNDQGCTNTEIYKGIKIIRVRAFHLNKKRLFARYLNYLSLFPSVLIKALTIKKHDCIILVSNPPFMYFIGWMVKKIKGSKLIFNVQDVYPDVAVRLKLLKSGTLIGLVELIAALIYRQAEKIICIGESMKKILCKKGVESERIAVVNNWADGKRLFPIEKNESPFAIENHLVSKYVIMYSGNFGMVHEIDTILNAAKELAGNEDLVFVLSGDGVNAGKIRSFIKSNDLKNIEMMPFLPREKLNYSLGACDLNLVSLKNGFEGLVVPSKVYGAMAVGRPILAIVPKGSEVATIINDNRCGVVVDPGNVSDCVHKILMLYKNGPIAKQMSKNAREAFMNKYERTISTDKYLKIIKEIES